MNIFLVRVLFFVYLSSSVGAAEVPTMAIPWKLPYGSISLEGDFYWKDYVDDSFQKGHVTCSADLQLGGKIIVNHSPRLATWKNGAEDVYKEHKTIYFDGVNWVRARLKGGGESSGRILKDASILSKPWEFSGLNLETCMTPFVQFWRLCGTSSTLMDANLDRFNIVWEEVDGGGFLLKVRIGEVAERVYSEDHFRFELSDNSLLLSSIKQRLSIVDGQAKLENHILYTDHRPVNGFSGFKIPHKTEFMMLRDGAAFLEGYSSISELSYSAETLSDKDFEGVFGPGWTINDLRFGTKFKIDKTATERAADIKRQLKK